MKFKISIFSFTYLFLCFNIAFFLTTKEIFLNIPGYFVCIVRSFHSDWREQIIPNTVYSDDSLLVLLCFVVPSRIFPYTNVLTRTQIKTWGIPLYKFCPPNLGRSLGPVGSISILCGPVLPSCSNVGQL